MQEVIARCFELENSRLDKPECYFNSLSEELRPKRDRLAKLLVEVGLEPVIPEGGYFMLADITKLAADFHTDETECKDSKFAKFLIREKVNYLLLLIFKERKINQITFKKGFNKYYCYIILQ
jgi:kynurenine--oxoglutarate transaminase/cysteine-S-conjugate beta-lyase/glutamine--phenylpyruvate transaminase